MSFANHSSIIPQLFSLVMPGIILILQGCHTGEQVSSHELIGIVERRSTETVNALWYMGSKDGNDYFCHSTALASKVYYVPGADFPLTNRFPLSHDKALWKLLAVPFSTLCITNESISISFPNPGDGEH